MVMLVACAALYVATSYGGIRSPDGEVVYRVAESLVTEGSFAVSSRIELWPEFGVAEGRDGRWYTFYGPGQPLVVAPMVALARALVPGDWEGDEARYLPTSHYVDAGLQDMLLDRYPAHPARHAQRRVAATLYLGVSVAVVALLWLLLRRLGIGRRAAVATAALYATGTLAWPYAHTFFKEPLALAFTLGAVLVTLERGAAGTTGRATGSRGRLAAAGLLLGCAVATQEMSVLFVPAWVAWIAATRGRSAAGLRGAVTPTAALLAGLAVVAAGLAAYNAARFGSPLETGRAAATPNPFFGPWTPEFYRGLFGLFLGAGKGLLLYCPAVLLSLPFWRRFHREYAPLSWLIVVAVAVRVLVVASYGAWHGGFGPGPRYLLMVVPLLLLPLAHGLDAALQRRDRTPGVSTPTVVLVLGFGCAVEQLYLVTGEVFSYSHIVKILLAEQHVDVFAGDMLYLSWALAPLGHLLEHERGPWLLQGAPGSNAALWLACCAVMASLTYLLATFLRRARGDG